MTKRSKVSMAVIIALSASGLSQAVANAQESAANDVEVIQVRGIQSSLTEAMSLKQNADSIQDSIVAEDIGKFPDQNVAESLQRITGVSISRVNGEGSQVTVRSFGPVFNVVKLNNRTLATSTGGREFDFQVLPSELIAGADVIKSPTADLAEGSVGAYINVRTARPLDSNGFHAAGSVNAKYHSLSQEVKPDVTAIVSDTFVDDTFGVLLGISYKDSAGRIDNYRTSHWNQYSGGTSAVGGYGFPLDPANVLGEDGNPTSLEGSRGPGRTIFNSLSENRERLGSNLVLQWEPNEHFMSTVDVLYTQLDRDYLGSGLQVPNQESWSYTDAVVSDSGTLLKATLSDIDMEMNVNYGVEKATTTAFGFNNLYTKDALTLEFDASYSKAKSNFEGDDTTALHYTRFDSNGNLLPSSISLDYSNDIPDLSTSGGIDVTDISKVRAAWQRYAANESVDEVTELKLDALYEIDAGPVESIKLGTAYSKRSIEYSSYGTEFDPTNGGETWDGAGMWLGDGSNWGTPATSGVIPNSVLTLSDSNFMDGINGNFPRQWVQIADHKAYRDATQALLEQMVGNGDDWRAGRVGLGWDTPFYSPGGSYANEEHTLATYLRVNLAGELGGFLWTGNVGGRYVSIDNTATGTASTIDLLYLNAESSQLPNSVDNTSVTSAKSSEVITNEHYFLPSANLKFDLDDGHIVRGAFAKTITRPGLSDSGVNVQESAGVDSPVVAISGGNPYLKSYQVSQFDLSYEYYANNGNTYSVGLFYKDISNFISTITTVGPWEGPIDPILADAYAVNNQSVSFTSSRKENRAGGTVKGLELGALHLFDELPGFWSGFGLQANYTFADSQDDDAAPVNLPSVMEPGNGLEGFAKNSYNFVGFYDKDGIQARIAYNWRDKFLSSRSGDGIQPEYNDSYGQLDMSMSYDINETFTVAFEASNLTNETRLQYYGQRDRVSLLEMSGTRYQLGVRATF